MNIKKLVAASLYAFVSVTCYISKAMDMDNDCLICLNEINVTNEHIITAGNCGHQFHFDCLRKWVNTTYEDKDGNQLNHHTICPKCRQQLSNDVLLNLVEINGNDDAMDLCRCCHRIMGDQSIIKTPCGHMFHTKCLYDKTILTRMENWKLNRGYCPNCDEGFDREFAWTLEGKYERDIEQYNDELHEIYSYDPREDEI